MGKTFESAPGLSEAIEHASGLPALKLTRGVAARCRLKREDLNPAGPSNAVLGNWYVTLQRIPEGNAFVYMSERSLLSFIMLEGERITPEKLSNCLVRGMLLALDQYYCPPDQQARLLAEYSAGTLPSKRLGFATPYEVAASLLCGGST